MLSRPFSEPGHLYCFDWLLALYSCGCYWSLACTADHRSPFWSLTHKVQKSSVYKRLVACTVFVRVLLVACLVDWLFTGYGRTSHKLASVTGEAAWSLAVCFNEILLVDFHRYAEGIVVCM